VQKGSLNDIMSMRRQEIPMEDSTTTFVVILMACLGLSLILAIIGIFLFYNWWDKF
jgi:hypothetical protein